VKLASLYQNNFSKTIESLGVMIGPVE